ncbi:Linoleate 10R-lipoxygenase [Rhizoctonia solani AG-1 IB]|uniref:Linoleate 10R-lipoxygenase n=1 Tax=Thanatephorus cucumeris (strain AG1-IB / isolate 7/3/14) TaxID=1108050 RepID=M5CGA8_THACB|nr:Linoleate 10R-lipoxygenase [Rhizoctonia solani AG-1 IB]
MAYLGPLEDIKELKETMTKMVGGDTALDDRKGTMNKIFAVIPKIPQDSEISKTMNDHLITMLYKSVPHPPTSYVGEDRFRKADGSRNNVNMPDLGRAGTTYARNVQGRRLQPPTSLPPTSMVYEELLGASGSM